MLKGLGAQVVCSLSSKLESGTQEGDRWIGWMIGCMDGVALGVLGAVMLNAPLRDRSVYIRWNASDQVWREYCGQLAGWTY